MIPTLGDGAALNLGLELAESGVLEELGIEMLGADPDVIKRAEDRQLFRNILDDIGASYPKSHMVKTFEQGLEVGEELGLPLILRPNYTLGGGRRDCLLLGGVQAEARVSPSGEPDFRGFGGREHSGLERV